MFTTIPGWGMDTSPAASAAFSSGRDFSSREALPAIHSSMEVSAAGPSPPALEEFQLLEAELLRGDLRLSGEGYLALLTVRQPGTLRLALDRIYADPIRKRMASKRLCELE